MIHHYSSSPSIRCPVVTLMFCKFVDWRWCHIICARWLCIISLVISATDVTLSQEMILPRVLNHSVTFHRVSVKYTVSGKSNHSILYIYICLSIYFVHKFHKAKCIDLHVVVSSSVVKVLQNCQYNECSHRPINVAALPCKIKCSLLTRLSRSEQEV